MFRVVNVHATFVAIQAGLSPYAARRTTGIVMVSSLFISGKEGAANAREHYTIGKEIVDLVLNRLLAQITSSLTATLRFDGALDVDVTDPRTFHLGDVRDHLHSLGSGGYPGRQTHVGSCSASNMTFTLMARCPVSRPSVAETMRFIPSSLKCAQSPRSSHCRWRVGTTVGWEILRLTWMWSLMQQAVPTWQQLIICAGNTRIRRRFAPTACLTWQSRRVSKLLASLARVTATCRIPQDLRAHLKGSGRIHGRVQRRRARNDAGEADAYLDRRQRPREGVGTSPHNTLRPVE